MLARIAVENHILYFFQQFIVLFTVPKIACISLYEAVVILVFSPEAFKISGNNFSKESIILKKLFPHLINNNLFLVRIVPCRLKHRGIVFINENFRDLVILRIRSFILVISNYFSNPRYKHAIDVVRYFIVNSVAACVILFVSNVLLNLRFISCGEEMAFNISLEACGYECVKIIGIRHRAVDIIVDKTGVLCGSNKIFLYLYFNVICNNLVNRSWFLAHSVVKIIECVVLYVLCNGCLHLIAEEVLNLAVISNSLAEKFVEILTH